MKNIFLNEQFQIPGYKLLDYITLPYQYSGNTIYEIFGSYKHIKSGRIDHYFISFILEKEGDGETQSWVVINKTISPLMDDTGHQASELMLNQFPSI